MAKRKITYEIYSYGIYARWDNSGKDLPKLIKITDKIPAEVHTEFGYVIEIKGAKGKKLEFVIEHPPFTDSSGEISPPFRGEHYISSNDYRFYLGDCIWEPVEDKKGPWRFLTCLEGKLLADKILIVQ